MHYSYTLQHYGLLIAKALWTAAKHYGQQLKHYGLQLKHYGLLTAKAVGTANS